MNKKNKKLPKNNESNSNKVNTNTTVLEIQNIRTILDFKIGPPKKKD